MYDVALTVRACLRADTDVQVGWAVATVGLPAPDPSMAVAITPGGGRVGSVLAGAVDVQLAGLAPAVGTGRFVDVEVSEVDALVAGFARGGSAQCVLMPATALPEELWDRLVRREPVLLVVRMYGDEVVSAELAVAEEAASLGVDVAQAVGAEVSTAIVGADRVVTVLFPVPRLVVVGGGPIVDALVAGAAILEWRVEAYRDPAAAKGAVVGLSALDKLVVFAHDLEAAGTVLQAALQGSVGYIGALGSRRMQQQRADWLAARGVTGLERIHGPAGLDIGASSPGEIAVSVLAEAIAAGR
ncbi:MAG TPA: XdhC family protein [Nocardioidaceae bacterium]|nr:XdhC family protein [Nocardioidaceae bacterium]